MSRLGKREAAVSRSLTPETQVQVPAESQRPPWMRPADSQSVEQVSQQLIMSGEGPGLAVARPARAGMVVERKVKQRIFVQR